MKKKTVEKILRGKFAQFLKSIEDKDLRKEVKNNSIITGGAIVSLLLNEKVNDFDVYFTNKQTVLKVAEYYRKMLVKEDSANQMIRIEDEFPNDKTDGRIKIVIPSLGIIRDKKIKKKKKFYPEILTDNAISLSDDIQLIIRFYGNPEQIHENFDFIHVMSYWKSDDGRLYLNPDSVEAVLAKELRYRGSLYPLASMFRLRKFLTRGWTITAGDIFKIGFQVSKLDFSDPQVMYDQLIGVDIHYFNTMIERIKSDLKEGKVKEVTSDYLSDLIEEIFHDSSEYYVDENGNYDEESDQ